jgi:hypothetical protein
MNNILSKKCIEKNCMISPSFNYEGETKALYCLAHKKIKMKNITIQNVVKMTVVQYQFLIFLVKLKVSSVYYTRKLKW